MVNVTGQASNVTINCLHPTTVPTSKPSDNDSEINASNKKLDALIASADNWRSRREPVYDNLMGLLNSINNYDKSRFTEKQNSKDAWDYMQSIQKTIEEEQFGITTKNKRDISINVYISGTGDIGDRAARSLDEWLKSHKFNTDKNNSSIYINVIGTQSSQPDPYNGPWISNTRLSISAKWLDGNIFFEADKITSKRSGGSESDAEDRSLSDAVSKLIDIFRSQIKN